MRCITTPRVACNVSQLTAFLHQRLNDNSLLPGMRFSPTFALALHCKASVFCSTKCTVGCIIMLCLLLKCYCVYLSQLCALLHQLVITCCVKQIVIACLSSIDVRCLSCKMRYNGMQLLSMLWQAMWWNCCATTCGVVGVLWCYISVVVWYR